MKKIFILGALLFITSIPMVSCTDDDDRTLILCLLI